MITKNQRLTRLLSSYNGMSKKSILEMEKRAADFRDYTLPKVKRCNPGDIQDEQTQSVPICRRDLFYLLKLNN